MIQNLRKAIELARRIVLVMHVSPDGDTCGTSLALRRAFLMIGKEVTVICDDAIPKSCQCLPDADFIINPCAVKDEVFDLAIAVDVSDMERMGSCASIFNVAKTKAQVDHHGTNPGFADINFITSPISATAVLGAELIDALSISFDPLIAECLYVAVASDTGNFKFQNTDAQGMRLAARCLDLGVNAQAIATRLFDNKPYPQMLLIAKAIESMQFFASGNIAMMQLTKKDFQDSGSLPEHSEGIVNFARDTEGVRMACLLSEQDHRIRCSLRSASPFDISKVAMRFDGGGHTQAAGCSLKLPLSEASHMIREALLNEWGRSQSTGSSIS